MKHGIRNLNLYKKVKAQESGRWSSNRTFLKKGDLMMKMAIYPNRLIIVKNLVEYLHKMYYLFWKEKKLFLCLKKYRVEHRQKDLNFLLI